MNKLIGGTVKDFSECIFNKTLPSNKDVLKVFLYYHGDLKKTVPKMKRWSIVRKIRELYEKECGSVKKSINRKSETNAANKHKFIDKLHNVFDITSQKRTTKKRAHEAKSKKIVSDVNELAFINFSSSSSETNNDSSDEDYCPPVKKSCSVKKQKVITPVITTTIDRHGMSNKAASLFISAVSSSINNTNNISNTTCSRESVRRYRRKISSDISKNIKNNFNPNDFMTVHWDGKIFKDKVTGEKTDRLVAVVTGIKKEQFLGLPVIKSSTGEEQADAVYQLLTQWNLKDQISCISSDTTASNTGKSNGACTLLQKKLNKDLIYLACRHHALECVISKVFNLLFEKSTEPQIQLFVKFRENWKLISNNNSYESTSNDKTINYLLEPKKNEITNFVLEQLKINHKRADYAELLKLVLLFIGKPADMNIKVSPPGADHRARRLSKIIYCLKIYIFRNSFELTNKELDALRIFNVFAVTVYLKYWFTCDKNPDKCTL